VDRSSSHWLGMKGAVETQVQFAKANQSVLAKPPPFVGNVKPGLVAHSNCSG
jgi:hypothetical protein